MELVFPKEGFWFEKLDSNCERIEPETPTLFSKISYTALTTMRNIDAHCWELDPDSVYADARSMDMLVETVRYILKNNLGLTQEVLNETVSNEPDEYERVKAIIDARADFGELLKTTIFERHEHCDTYSCFREIGNTGHVMAEKLFAKLAFSRDYALCERLFQHYDALGEFDHLKETGCAESVSPSP